MADFRRQGGPAQARRDGGHPPPAVSDEEIKSIIRQGDGKTLNAVCERLGRYYAEGPDREKLSTSQVRSVLDRIQRMTGYEPYELQMLRPLLAYTAGRHGGKVVHLYRTVDQAVSLVDDQESFRHFVNFFEAVVAYHRCHGGKE